MEFLPTAAVLILTLGCAWPFVAQLSLSSAEKLLALPALSLVAAYLVSGSIYVFDFSPLACWILPLSGFAGAVWKGRRALVVLRTTDVAHLCLTQLLVTGWAIGWLLLVLSYSGGGWAGDWVEHWQRTQFFADRGSLDTRFIGLYPLPARPPLANIVTATVLQCTVVDFPRFQLVMTIWSSLAFLPCALLCRRFAPGNERNATAVLAVALMLNPLFVQNATFAWTKLPTAFFVLTSLYFFLRGFDADNGRSSAPVSVTCLAAGILTHYSAIICAGGLAMAWLFLQRKFWSTRAFWCRTAGLLVMALVLLGTWFSWSGLVFGWGTTVLSNSTATEMDPQPLQQLWKMVVNVRDTIVPHFLRPVDHTLINQRSAWGYLRDWFFQLYQVNLWFACGSIAGIMVLRVLVRDLKGSAAQAGAWAAYILPVITVGIAVHGARDHWGLAHICLQPVVLLAITYLAASYHGLKQSWRLLLMVGATVDAVFGIVLHFGIQSFAVKRWLTTGQPASDWFTGYSETFLLNLRAKTHFGLSFIGDRGGLSTLLVLALLAAILTLAIVRAAPAHTSPD